MQNKEEALKEFKKYEQMRMQMYDFFEQNIKKNNKGQFDFENSDKLDAKEVYEMFFKLDYQARKIRGIAVECLGVKPE